ncbi:MAG TPA: GNAT family protein [Anaerolineaceae bacterium]|nr:GNAT family protein [Anaerolineaceae bacterium]
MPLLKTPRLFLRPFQETDLATFVAYRSDPDVARYQSWALPFTLEQATDFLKEMEGAQVGEPGTWYQFAVERQSHPGLIGDCAFQVASENEHQAQIGYTFSPSYQKQGYATEAVRGLLDYLFGDLHLHRVTATCDVENVASFRLLERIGMRREAHLVENIWFKGAWGSEYLYALLSKEWNQGHHSTQSAV